MQKPVEATRSREAVYCDALAPLMVQVEHSVVNVLITPAEEPTSTPLRNDPSGQSLTKVEKREEGSTVWCNQSPKR